MLIILNNMTEELFRNNSYIQDCEAKIIEIIDEGIILDKTIFYPEGGETTW